jgi:hypothetical protein
MHAAVNSTSKSVVISVQLLFIFHSSSFSLLQALEECKPHLSQNYTGKNQGGGGG